MSGSSKVSPDARDWSAAGLAVVGLVLSAYLAWTRWAGAAALFCERGSGCDVVQASRYATFLGVPTAVWGVVLYAAVLALVLAGRTPGRWTAAYALAVVATTFSAYLTYIALGELNAVCPYCLADAIIAPALLVTVLLRGPTAGRRAAVRRGRLVVIGATLSVATVIFAGGVFVSGGPTASSTHQESLARHLADSGAYW